MERRILHMNLELKPMTSTSCLDLKFSLHGDVSEHGQQFGFGSPLKFLDEVEDSLKHSLSCRAWGLFDEEFKIIPVWVFDCRETAKQLDLFGNEIKKEVDV